MLFRSRNGSVTKTHVGTVFLEQGQTKYSVMTDHQQKELYQIYEELIRSIFNQETCDQDGKCH